MHSKIFDDMWISLPWKKERKFIMEEKDQKKTKWKIRGCVIVCIMVILFLLGSHLWDVSRKALSAEDTTRTTSSTSSSSQDVEESVEEGEETIEEASASDDFSEAETEGTSSEAVTDAQVTTQAETEESSSSESTEQPPISSDNIADCLKIEVFEVNSWGENPHYIQINGYITNVSDKEVSNWVLEIAVGKDATEDTHWSSNVSFADGIMTVNGVEYNSVLAPGAKVDFGVILRDVTGDLTTRVVGGMVSEYTGNPNNGGNNNNNNGNNNGNHNDNNQQNSGALEVPEPSTDDWLFVKGNKIVDASGKEVWLTGINWFGYNTGTNTFDGLWACDLNTSLQAIADHGFNLLRIPISAELVLQWKSGEYPSANFNQATNFYLVGMDSLEIFDYVIGQCRANGLKIMLDIHSAETDSMGHMTNLWYTNRITAAQYQEALCYLAERYCQDDTIIAYDLKNEPHGKPYEDNKAIWNDSTDANNWKHVAEETALMVLEKNPNVLVLVEGIEIYPMDLNTNANYASKNEKDYYFNWWGGNLRGVKDFPLELGKYQNKLVYSPHDYGPSVYRQPWFYDGYNYDTLMEDCWRDNWFYIYEENTAPLLIGEWGGFMKEPNLTWMTHMRTLIGTYHLHHTFWCFNANSGDTGGLVKDDFVTWDEEKYAFVKEVLWQQDGKFVGLDHEIPLGTAGNGITLSEAK